MNAAVKHVLIFLVRFYRHALRPAARALGLEWSCCRYLPTCSQYALDALERHGAWTGSVLAARRILRCHPWGGHGWDPVPPVKQIAPTPARLGGFHG